MKTTKIPLSLLTMLLGGCAATSALGAADELTLSATTGSEESVVNEGDTLSPADMPASDRPDPFRVCDASGTYTGLFATYDTDGDGRLDAPESSDVFAARGDRTAMQERMVMMQWGLLLTLYDLDGSVSLDASERATLLADFTERCTSIQAILLATYDADGDGTLSAEEQDTARAAIEADMEAHRPPDGGPPPGDAPPPGGPLDGAPPIPPPLMDEFDVNGDDTLDAGELATMRDTMRARIRAGDPLCGM